MAKIMGNIVGLPSPRSDWNQTDETKADYIKNKPIEEIQAVKSLQYYGDANIVPSDASLFYVITDDATMTAKICSLDPISGDVVVPYEVTRGGKTYEVTSIGWIALLSSAEITIPKGITNIDSGAFDKNLVRISLPNTIVNARGFEYCTTLTDIYYTGTKKEWDTISMGIENDALDNATIHYECVPATNEIRSLIDYLDGEVYQLVNDLADTNEQVGNIDTALEAIISIQNSLIGGDA